MDCCHMILNDFCSFQNNVATIMKKTEPTMSCDLSHSVRNAHMSTDQRILRNTSYTNFLELSFSKIPRHYTAVFDHIHWIACLLLYVVQIFHCCCLWLQPVGFLFINNLFYFYHFQNIQDNGWWWKQEDRFPWV